MRLWTGIFNAVRSQKQSSAEVCEIFNFTYRLSALLMLTVPFLFGCSVNTSDMKAAGEEAWKGAESMGTNKEPTKNNFPVSLIVIS